MRAPGDATPKTLLDKVWERHLVRPPAPDTPAVLYVDCHLLHEVTSPQAFRMLAERGLGVRRPERTFATMDHAVPTLPLETGAQRAAPDAEAAAQMGALERNCRAHGIPLFGPGHPRQGVIHVTFPELGTTRPGMTVVCGDSHTSTHGAFGALGFGIGTSEVAHVLATQCLLMDKPACFAVDCLGRLGSGVTAKDLALALIARVGAGGAAGCVFEYRGPVIGALSMDERMTLCNMSIEAGARAGMIAPDEATFAYLAGRASAPTGADWERALEDWGGLQSDAGASFDLQVSLDASDLTPMITWGTSPDQAIPIRDPVPHPEGDAGRERALRYMGVEPGRPLLGAPVDAVFIGSCTNGRLSDLALAASIMRGRRVAPNMRVLVVPGSREVRRQAEAEGLDRVFRESGAEWREPGCSMCIAMNGDRLEAGQYAVSTSNRNFEGRQGPGSRTFLASPLTAAAAAVAGRIVDPREMAR